MNRVDFYVQQLIRHNAVGVEFASAEVIRFRFADGSERKTNAAVEHAQILQLVQQVIPTAAMQELQAKGEVAFSYRTHDEFQVNVNVRTVDANVWHVRVAPKSEREATVAAKRSAGVSQRPPAPAKESLEVSAHKAAAISIPPPQALTPAPAMSPVLQDLPSSLHAPASLHAPTPAPAPVSTPTPPRIDPSAEPRIHYYLRRIIELGGSDLHLSSEVVPLVRLHGEMHPLDEGRPVMPASELRAVLMEIAPEKNQLEFEEKNDTDFAHPIPGLARFRANYFMDRNGIGAVFRQIPFEILPPEKLGIPKQVLDLCWLSKGLVLVTGPTGSGKSTTLATLIDYVNSNRADHIITIEDPIEFVHPNKKCLVNQREIGTHTDSFKSALRAALREDPDIVLVGEMRDLETIAIAIETAETGHLVFGTLHTNTATSTVDRIIDQFPADRQEQIRTMLSESLKGVIAQVLCKKKGGGRAAVYEVLMGNSAVANLIREGKTFQLISVMQTGKNQGMQTMNEHFLSLVKAGTVEANEAYIKAVDKAGLKDLFTKNNIQLTL